MHEVPLYRLSEVLALKLVSSTVVCFRGTSLIRNSPLLGPYSRPTPRVLEGSKGGGRCLISEVPLYMKGKVLYLSFTISPPSHQLHP